MRRCAWASGRWAWLRRGCNARLQVGRSAPPSCWPPCAPASSSTCWRCPLCWPRSTPPSTTLPGASALRGWCWPSARGVAVSKRRNAAPWMLLSSHAPIFLAVAAWVEPMLRWRPLVVLARLSYCVYISHGAIQMYTAATIRTPIYASLFNVVSPHLHAWLPTFTPLFHSGLSNGGRFGAGLRARSGAHVAVRVARHCAGKSPPESEQGRRCAAPGNGRLMVAAHFVACSVLGRYVDRRGRPRVSFRMQRAP